jgi:cytochrome c553
MVRPRLAGQQDEYLLKTMTDFHTGERNTYPGMVALMKSIDEGEIKSLATYLAGLKLPAHPK